MKYRYKIIMLVVPICLTMTCGGGGSSNSVVPKNTVNWEVPTQFSDGTTFDPQITLKEYEIFVRQDINFSPVDKYVIVSAVDPSSHQLVTSFDLGLAYSGLSLSKGVTYYTAMRAVTTDGVRSDFSLPSPAFSF